MLRNTRRYFLLLLAALATGFLVYKFRHPSASGGFQWAKVSGSLRHANIPLLLLATLTVYVCFAIRAVRWMRFSHALGRTHFWNVYSATLMGFSCMFLLGRPGEPVRPVLIAKKDSLPVSGMFGVYVLERIFDMASTAVMAGVALMIFQHRGLMNQEHVPMIAAARSAGALLLLALVVVIAFLIHFRYHGAQWLAEKLRESTWRTGWHGKIVALLEGFSKGLQGIRNWGDLGALVAYTVAHWLLVVMCYLWVAHAFGGQLAQLDFSGAVLVLAITMVGSVAQFPGVGGGAQAGTFLVLTLIFGVEEELAATVAITTWLITFASCCLVGVPLLFGEGWSMGELKRMAQAEGAAGKAALLAEAEHPGNTGESSR